MTASWESFEINDSRIVGLTVDSGVLIYRVAARRAEEEQYSAVISSTFVRQQGAWKLAFHQQSPESSTV